MSDCIFCKIAAGAIPSRKVYEDEHLLAFHDLQPAAPVHFLIIPKVHVASLVDVNAQEHAGILARILLLAPRVALEQGLDEGFRTIINTGKGGGQTVYHLHAHVLGGGAPRPLGQALPATHA
jgi:histidine triad (HIT) family protein